MQRATMSETSNGKYIECRKGRDGDYSQIGENKRNSETMRTDA